MTDARTKREIKIIAELSASFRKEVEQLENANRRLIDERDSQAKLAKQLLDELVAVRAQRDHQRREIADLNDAVGQARHEIGDRQRVLDAFVKLAGRLP